MKLSFSLKGKDKEKPVGAAPPLKRPAAFGSLDDDTSGDAAATLSGDSKSSGNVRLIAQNAGMSKTAKKRMEAEQQVDSTVYLYDEVWDNMQVAKEKQKEAKQKESGERKVRITVILAVRSD
jgi:coiled-coil domain-containing protein 55